MPASVRSADPRPAAPTPAPVTPPTSGAARRLRDTLATLPILLLVPVLLLPLVGAQAGSDSSLVATSSQLAALPTSGSAWVSMKSIADGTLGTANLTNQDNRHAVNTLAVAFVANRLDSDAYRAKARAAILSAMGTERVGAENSILALGRQLGAYVIAADLIGLDGTDDTGFRRWLSGIRTRELGGHGRYTSLRGTCEDSPHNWGTFACASLFAADLYLGDSTAVARDWAVFRGLAGDRSAYAGFQDHASDVWACPDKPFTPFNSGCPTDTVRYGAFVKDVTRGSDPPTADGAGLSYTAEITQGIALQAELLSRAGYTDAWTRIRPAFDWARRNGAINLSSVDYHVTWWINRRYGWSLPTKPATNGRVFAYTDWLYGSAAAIPGPTATPAPSATATPKPSTTATATPTTAPTGSPTAAPSATPTPTAAAPSGTPAPTASGTPSPTSTAAPTATPTPAPTQAPVVRAPQAVRVVDATTGATTDTTKVTIARPAGVRSGDLLVAAIDARGAPAVAAPEGWKQLDLTAKDTTLRIATFVRVAGDGEPGSYTFSLSKPQVSAGTIVALRGADGSTPVADVAGKPNEKSRSVETPDARADSDQSLLLSFFAAAHSTSITAPDGHTELVEVPVSGAKYRTTLAVAVAVVDSGTVDGPTARLSVSTASVGQVVVVRP